MKIGAKIKHLRLQYQLTQEELANRCELTKGFISQLENDLNSPSISTLTDILAALGTNLKDFFNEEEEPQIVFKKMIILLLKMLIIQLHGLFLMRKKMKWSQFY